MAEQIPVTTDPNARRKDAEQAMLMREVDEAVRQDQVGDLAKRYGIIIAGVLVLFLASFGGWLLWQNQQESAMEERSEALVIAIDELEAGNDRIADTQLQELAADAEPGAAASAQLIRAGIAVRQNRREDAIALYNEVLADGEAPVPYRDYAAVRAVALQYDELEPQEVIDRLGPLAVSENPWFGSAGELVAMAYLAQGNEQQAGQLLAEIARDESVPQTLRARTRQLAGLLGFDAVEDVDEALAELTEAGTGGPAAVPAPAGAE